MCQLIFETFDSGDVCFYTFVVLVRHVLSPFCRRWQNRKFSNQQIKWKRVMPNLSMFGESREVVPQWSAKITSLDFSCESFVEFRLFRTISSVSGFMENRRNYLFLRRWLIKTVSASFHQTAKMKNTRTMLCIQSSIPSLSMQQNCL